jgi:hypothetical protein
VAAIFALSLLLTGRSVAAQEARPVYVPVTFHADTGALRTTACLQVREYRLPNSQWWEATQKTTVGIPAAPAFRGVVAALMSRDTAALQKLSATAQVKDAAEFSRQAQAYFDQIRTFGITHVERAYEFDGLFVFFAGLKQGKGPQPFAPFAFVLEGETFRFLPNRSGIGTTYLLVRDWFNAAWGPSTAAEPAYCDDATVARASHRVSLDPKAAQPSTLFLRGASLATPGALADVAARVIATDAAMKETAAKGAEALARHMPPVGAGRLAKWAKTAPELERRNYADAILRSRPFFVFDLGTVLVLFTQTPQGLQVMYFTAGSEKTLLWTNSSRGTNADIIFKQGSVFQAAQTEPPFIALAIGTAK